MKTLQFELWMECNNNCDFCYLGKDNRNTSDEIKIISIDKAYNKICDSSIIKDYECLGFIGGEFFQGQLKNPTVKEHFMRLIKKAAELHDTDKIKQIWITATMTIGSQKEMYETLDLFKNHKGVWLVTSWDSKGRFKSDKMLSTWTENMKLIKEKYPEIGINVSIILTQDLINRYLNEEFTFHELAKKWKCSFFLKQPIADVGGAGSFESYNIAIAKQGKEMPWFFPKRIDFLNFLIKFFKQEPKEYIDHLYNINLRADLLIRNFNNGKQTNTIRFKNEKREVSDSNTMPCGHPFVYCTYSDSRKCMMCDKLNILKSMELI